MYVLRSACAHGVASARLRPRDPKGRGSGVKEHANVLPWSADRDDGVHGLAVPATTQICPCQSRVQETSVGISPPVYTEQPV